MAFLLIYCSGHFQRPPRASLSNSTGLMVTLRRERRRALRCRRYWRPFHWLSPCRLSVPALEAITGEHFGGGGFAPHQWAQTVLIIPEVPSAAKLEPITKQLRYSQKEADGRREKGKKNDNNSTTTNWTPQWTPAGGSCVKSGHLEITEIFFFLDNWKFWPPSTIKI